jgi:tetratricopeptide (TPR) repeat protein
MEPGTTQLIERARTAFDRRNYEAALADVQQTLAVEPNFADLRNLAGLCLSFLGRTEEALAEFDRALVINPRYVEAHLNRALTLTDLGRYDEAAVSFHNATLHEHALGGRFSTAASAKLANAHAELGDLYAESGAISEAAEQYRRALTLRPEFHDIRNKLAETLMDLGEFELAEAELRQALAGNARFMNARLNLGLLLYRMERLDEAEAEWRACERQQPENRQLRAFLALLNARMRYHRHEGREID